LKNGLILEPQRLTSPTVKVRRLGYLTSIPLVVQDREVPVRMLNSIVCNWARKNRKFFEHYSLELPVTRTKKRLLTGEIRTAGAAGRYVRTCEELGLLVRVGEHRRVKIGGFRVSKTGKAILALSTDGNPFKLTTGQSFLILKSLLEKDYDCLSVLVKVLRTREKSRMDSFRIEIQSKLHRKIEKATEMNRLYLVDALKKRVEILRNWKKPLRYYSENIEAPRLEWMVDLKLLKHWNQRTSTVDLRDDVEVFFEEDIIDHKWLYDEFPYIYVRSFSELFKDKVQHWVDLDRKEKLNLLDRLLAKSMAIFKTGVEIGKISADEFFEYSLGFLIQNESVVTSLGEFEKDLISFTRSGKLNYRYLQTISPVDRGYITKA
jgi:hypothetical protein